MKLLQHWLRQIEEHSRLPQELTAGGTAARSLRCHSYHGWEVLRASEATRKRRSTRFVILEDSSNSLFWHDLCTYSTRQKAPAVWGKVVVSLNGAVHKHSPDDDNSS